MDKPKGFIVITSVNTKVRLELEKAINLFTKYGFENQLPANRKMSDIWERCTSIKTTFRKDIELAWNHKNKKVRFYTSKVKGDLGTNGQLTRHLVMEVVDSDLNLEIKYDLDYTSDAGRLADEQRVNKPIAIMKYNDNDFDQKSRFYWTDYDAKDGYGFLQEGEAARIIGEIKEKIALESGTLNNREIWKSISLVLDSMGAYSLTTRGSAYFIPVGADVSETRKTLKSVMDLINELRELSSNDLGKSSCTVWEVTQNATNDYFGSASEVLTNSLLELNERIAQFANDVTKNKREKTMRAEWLEIQKHVGLFKGILGNKLEDIESSLKEAVSNIQISQYQLNIDSDITQVLDSFEDFDIPQLDLVEDTIMPELEKADNFEIEL